MKKVKNYDFEGGIYIGEIKAGTPHGWGKLSWPDGEIYTGHFIEGEAYGQGTLTSADGKVETGGWEKGEFVGNTAIEYEEVRGITANSLLLEILCWLVISIVSMVFDVRYIFVIWFLTFLIITVTIIFTKEERQDPVQYFILYFGSFFTFPLIVIIGDLFRFIVVRRFYTGHKPLKYGVLKNIETYSM